MTTRNDKARGQAGQGAQQVTQHANPTATCDDDQAGPFTSRRRFLIAALMAGWTSPQVVTERIVAEVNREAGA